MNISDLAEFQQRLESDLRKPISDVLMAYAIDCPSIFLDVKLLNSSRNVDGSEELEMRLHVLVFDKLNP